jgi:hypothetical protein
MGYIAQNFVHHTKNTAKLVKFVVCIRAKLANH